MGNTLVIANLTDEQYAGIAALLGFDSGAEAIEATAVEFETGKVKKDKKGKKNKSEPESAEAETPDEPAVTYTAKDLGKKDRDELVSILVALGTDADSLKGKRATTLVTLITEKQKELAAAAKSSEKSNAKGSDKADDWDEDVPPADDAAPKKKGDKKAKDKSGKKGSKKK